MSEKYICEKANSKKICDKCEHSKSHCKFDGCTEPTAQCPDEKCIEVKEPDTK
jgi:hypothetical protein